MTLVPLRPLFLGLNFQEPHGAFSLLPQISHLRFSSLQFLTWSPFESCPLSPSCSRYPPSTINLWNFHSTTRIGDPDPHVGILHMLRYCSFSYSPEYSLAWECTKLGSVVKCIPVSRVYCGSINFYKLVPNPTLVLFLCNTCLELYWVDLQMRFWSIIYWYVRDSLHFGRIY